jgi:hypothetical protein
LSNTASLHTSRAEPQLWAKAWAREGLAPAACPYIHIHPEPGGTRPEALTSAHTRALCMITTQIDALMHGETQGSTGFYAALGVWLKSGEAVYVEHVIAEALRQGYVVAVTSDHGHTEAYGMGTPSEGVLVETRSHRARLYEDQAMAARAHAAFPATVRWEADGLLPEGVSALLPRDDAAERGAFTRQDRRIISHGGASLDEVVVPLVVIQ